MGVCRATYSFYPRLYHGIDPTKITVRNVHNQTPLFFASKPMTKTGSQSRERRLRSHEYIVIINLSFFWERARERKSQYNRAITRQNTIDWNRANKKRLSAKLWFSWQCIIILPTRLTIEKNASGDILTFTNDKYLCLPDNPRINNKWS